MHIKLNNSVGNNLSNQKKDVFQVKKALDNFRLFDFSSEQIPHGYITSELRNSIMAYQKGRGLRIDGNIFPQGETESNINKDIKLLSDSDDGDMPALPPPSVKSEVLPPPEKNIPGTDIPDRGIPEQGFPGSGSGRGRFDPNYQSIPGTRDFNVIIPPNIDPQMPEIEGNFPLPPRKWDI